jgi:hypothetical protein
MSETVPQPLVPSESTFAYFEALKTYLRRHGKPVAFYSDKHSIFRVSKENAVSGNVRIPMKSPG